MADDGDDGRAPARLEFEMADDGDDGRASAPPEFAAEADIALLFEVPLVPLHEHALWFSPDSRWLAVGTSEASLVTVVDVERQTLVCSLPADYAAACWFGRANENTDAILVTSRTQVYMWELPASAVATTAGATTAATVPRLGPSKYSVPCRDEWVLQDSDQLVVVAPNGRVWCHTAPERGLVTLHATHGGEELWRSTVHLEPMRPRGGTASATCAAFSPNSSQLAFGTTEGAVFLCDAESGAVQHTLYCGRGIGTFNDLAYSSDGSRLLGITAGQRMFVWDPREGIEVSRGMTNQHALARCAWAHSDSMYAVAGESLVSVFDLAAAGPTLLPAAPYCASTYCQFFDNDRLIATWCMSNLRIIEARTGAVIYRVQYNIAQTISPDSRLLAVGSHNGTQVRDLSGLAHALPPK